MDKPPRLIPLLSQVCYCKTRKIHPRALPDVPRKATLLGFGQMNLRDLHATFSESFRREQLSLSPAYDDAYSQHFDIGQRKGDRDTARPT